MKSTCYQIHSHASCCGTILSSTFTGKVKDSESGYHYFGARYYDSEALTGWLSVDPMMDKYPSMSPYNYCAWSPVKLVDRDGKEAQDNDDWVKKTGSNDYVWFDFVHNAATTPSGYEYVGSENTDILKNMGIPEEFPTQQSTRTGHTAKIGIPLGVIYGNKVNQSTARLYARAYSIKDQQKRTNVNKEGRVFSGIEFSASVTQKSFDVNTGYGTMNYKGGLSIFFADPNYSTYDRLAPSANEQFNAPNERTTFASCFIDAQVISQHGVPKTASVKLGYCNQSTRNRAIDFEWKLN